MKTSESIANIAPALLAAQKTVAKVAKTGRNTFHKSPQHPEGYPHATLDDVLDACKAALNEKQIVFVQGTEPSESGEVLHLTTRLLHSSGEWIESTLTMKPVKADPQGIGSCITYARRYALAAICGVASEEDDDANAASAPVTSGKANAPVKPSAPATVPTGGNVHDEVPALLGRIAVQKKRKGAQMSEENWSALLCHTFEVKSKNEIANLTPMQLKVGIDKLAAIIDEQEQQ